MLKHKHLFQSRLRKAKNFSLFKNYLWCIDKTWCFKCEYSKFSIRPGKQTEHEFMHLESGYEAKSLTYRSTPAPSKGFGHSLKCPQHCSNKDRNREIQ